MRPRLHNLIFLCMAIGIAVGLPLAWSNGPKDKDKNGFVTRQEWKQAGEPADTFDAEDADGDGQIDVGWYHETLLWLDLVGKIIFIGLLKMIIAPLILVSIVAGITSIPSFGEAGRIGWKALAYYVVTTTVAVTLGLVLVLAVQPGTRGNAETMRTERLDEIVRADAAFRAETGLDPTAEENEARWLTYLAEREGETRGERYQRVASKKDRSTYDMFVDDIVRPMIANPFASLTTRNSLGIIFFAIVLALACMAVGEPARPLIDLFQAANHVVMRITIWLMAISPFAILCLLAAIVARHGPAVFETLGWYCGTVVAGILIHSAFLLLVVWVVGRKSPLAFIRGIREAWAIAFATRSSAATLPVTVRCVTKNLGVSPKVANFTLPVGATLNMDGTALYEGVAVIFLIQIFGSMPDVGITLEFGHVVLIFVTAVLASVGAAAVPDAGLVTMVLVATAVGLPVYYLPFIFAVDALLDMFRTSVNIMGDAIGAVVVDRLEGDQAG